VELIHQNPNVFRVIYRNRYQVDAPLCERVYMPLSRQTIPSSGITWRTSWVTIDRLSGGQRQAVAIARALRWKAKLVILDEPTAALSLPKQQKVLSLTRQLASQGVAVIYITHNILDVMAVTDRLAILHRGRKAAQVATKDTTEHEIVSLIMGKAVR
jgi:ABC-type sugar transport system ATPase subunit